MHLQGESTSVWSQISPSCSSFALWKTVEDNCGLFGKELLDMVLDNFYVDDCLKPVVTKDDATKLVDQL